MHSRLQPRLYPLTNRPVLAVNAVPEFHCVGWIEVRLLNLPGMKKKLAYDARALRTLWGEQERGYVIAAQAQQHVGVDQFPKMPGLFRFV